MVPLKIEGMSYVKLPFLLALQKKMPELKVGAKGKMGKVGRRINLSQTLPRGGGVNLHLNLKYMQHFRS